MSSGANTGRHVRARLVTGLLIGVGLCISLAAGGTSPPPSVVVKVGEGGFHWADAAVGAAATFAVGLLVLGVVMTFRAGRRRV
jgi:hypothetical protein